jgi:hypothetical protein
MPSSSRRRRRRSGGGGRRTDDDERSIPSSSTPPAAASGGTTSLFSSSVADGPNRPDRDDDIVDRDDHDIVDVDHNDDVASSTTSYHRAEYQDLYSKFAVAASDSDDGTMPPPQSTSIENMIKGIPDGYCIIESRTVPEGGFSQSRLDDAFAREDIDRLKLRPDDLTIPCALLLMFPEQFATQTRARKECRRRRILIIRRRDDPRDDDDDDGGREGDGGRLNVEGMEIAMVGDRA